MWSKDVTRLSIFLFRGISTKPVAHGFASSTSVTTNGPRCPLAISTVDILNEKGRIVSPFYNLSVNGNFLLGLAKVTRIHKFPTTVLRDYLEEYSNV